MPVHGDVAGGEGLDALLGVGLNDALVLGLRGRVEVVGATPGGGRLGFGSATTGCGDREAD